MPNICKLYDIAIKTGKKNGDQANLGDLRTYRRPRTALKVEIARGEITSIAGSI
ncbi:MAG: hypothetical protein ACLP51_03765 [Syntrophobacteraceae bacterium]